MDREAKPVPPPVPVIPEPPLSERAREIQIILAALRERRRTLDASIAALETEFLNQKYRPAGQKE